MQIYVADLSDYNQGFLTGIWIDLEGMSDEEEIHEQVQTMLEKRTKETGELHEEWGIHDYDSAPVGLSEYEDFKHLIEIQQAIDEHDDDIVEACFDCGIPLNKINDCYVGQYADEEDYAYQYCEDVGILSQIPENLKNYFDYSSFGRDIFLNGDMQGSRVNGQFYVFHNNY